MAAGKRAMAMARRCSALGLERARERAEAEVRAEAAPWCSRDPLGPDRWGRGWRTDATARPHGGNGLRPVGHGRLKKLNGSPKTMTNRAISSLIIS
jgi:hypothetical protein